MDIYEEIKLFQFDIDTIIAQKLREFEFIRNYLNMSRGKRLRSKLYWLACKILGETPSPKIAAAFEILHQATLMHDDVLDDADVRRNIKTISAEKGNTFSILSGDILLASCMKLIAEGHSFRLIHLFSELATNLIQGELKCQSMQLSADMSEYKQNVYLKTGCFFEIIIKSVRYKNNNLVPFGHAFGIFFQMVDDYKDCFCIEAVTGKKQFQDLMSRTITFPIILAYKHATVAEKEEIQKFFNGGHSIDSVITIVNKVQKKSANLLSSQKIRILASLRQVTNSSYKEEILRLVDTIY